MRVRLPIYYPRKEHSNTAIELVSMGIIGAKEHWAHDKEHGQVDRVDIVLSHLTYYRETTP